MPRTTDPTRPASRPDTLDDALDRLAGYSYLDGAGFPCHGPMGAETLSTLGHDDLVAGWVEAYRERHPALEAPPPGDRIDPADEASWRPALGSFARVADWSRLFQRELEDAPWSTVLERWVPRLLPGYGGGLTHGLIRTGHAVRALPPDGAPSALRRGELARGLALWAASYTPLPGRPRLDGPRSLDEAIQRLPRVSPDAGWSVMDAASFARIGELPGFPGAVEAMGRSDAGWSALSAAFCRVMLAHPDTLVGPLVHTVTPIGAARTLAAQLPDAVGDALLAQTWHVGAAIVASFTTSPRPEEQAIAAGDHDVPSLDELVARAVEHQDPHALKFAEACHREHGLGPDPVYARAVQHVLGELPPW